LAQKLRVRHSRCSYGALLQHYCPVDVSSHGSFFFRMLG
jgi:hypothetical protein